MSSRKSCLVSKGTMPRAQRSDSFWCWSHLKTCDDDYDDDDDDDDDSTTRSVIFPGQLIRLARCLKSLASSTSDFHQPNLSATIPSPQVQSPLSGQKTWWQASHLQGNKSNSSPQSSWSPRKVFQKKGLARISWKCETYH